MTATRIARAATIPLAAALWLLAAWLLWRTRVPEGLRLPHVQADRLVAPGILARTRRHDAFLRVDFLLALLAQLLALAAVASEGAEAIWCLGDLVGYGPRPNECCAAVAAVAAICLVGNHDLGVLGRIDLLDFSGDAAAAARWSRQVLTGQARDYLEGLESTASVATSPTAEPKGRRPRSHSP